MMSGTIEKLNETRRGLMQQAFISLGMSVSSLRIDSTRRCEAGVSEALMPGANSVICFFLDGGLTHLDSFDPKPLAPREIRGEFSAIATSVPGLQFSENWPQMSRWANQLTVLRSVSHRHMEHGNATRCMHAMKEAVDQRTPALGAVLEWQLKSELPQYVSIPSLRDYSGALGAEYQSYAVLGPVGQSLKNDAVASGGFRHRLNLLDKLRLLQQKSPETGDSVSLVNQQRKVRAVLESEAFQRIVQVDSSDHQDRELFGNSETAKMAVMARNANREGVRFVVVNLPGWDMHGNLIDSSRRMMPDVDRAVSGILEDLKNSGRLETTLVLIMSEFGRSPEMDTSGPTPGRHHWPRAMSLIVSGGPVPKGQVIGDTGAYGHESEIIRHKPDDLSATLYKWLGLDRDIFLPGEGALLNTAGSVISELGLS